MYWIPTYSLCDENRWYSNWHETPHPYIHYVLTATDTEYSSIHYVLPTGNTATDTEYPYIHYVLNTYIFTVMKTDDTATNTEYSSIHYVLPTNNTVTDTEYPYIRYVLTADNTSAFSYKIK